MKKVSGCMDSRPLGCYKFEFYVPDDMSDEQIKEEVERVCDYYISYDVEAGYEECTEICYRKKK